MESIPKEHNMKVPNERRTKEPNRVISKMKNEHTSHCGKRADDPPDNQLVSQETSWLMKWWNIKMSAVNDFGGCCTSRIVCLDAVIVRVEEGSRRGWPRNRPREVREARRESQKRSATYGPKDERLTLAPSCSSWPDLLSEKFWLAIWMPMTLHWSSVCWTNGCSMENRLSIQIDGWRSFLFSRPSYSQVPSSMPLPIYLVTRCD